MKSILIISLLLLSSSVNAQKEYKQMMEDLTINFYDVCRKAESYFATHDKGKGSGWKGYQRWKNANEYKYYPSGNRNGINPLFAEQQLKAFRFNNPQPKDLYSNGWNELGPRRIDSISDQYSVGLGRIEDHYVNPSNPDQMYVGSRSGGFWSTNDGGLNWNGGSTDYLIATGVNTIAVSPTNSDSILINLQNARNEYSHGIYRSTDGGVNWVESNFNPTNVGFGGFGNNFRISVIKYHPRVPNLIFIGTNEGIYRSDDNLATWTVMLGQRDISQIEFHPTNDDIIYMYDDYYWGNIHDYVIRTEDQGISYTISNVITANADNRSVHLSVSNDCASCVYFASDNGVWKSTNDGVDFTFMSNPPQGCGGFAVNDQDTSMMIYGYVDLEASSNGGQTFTQKTFWSLGNTNGAGSGHQNSFETSTNYIHADLHPAKCVNGIFYVGTDGFFSRSVDNGTTWEMLSQGVGTRENYNLGVSQSNHYTSISGSQDNGTSIKKEDTWLEYYGADGMEGIIHPLNDTWMIGSLQYGGRLKTTDGGLSNVGATPGGSEDGGWEAPLTYDPNNQMKVYDFRETIYMSEDFGVSWNAIGTPSSFTGTIDESAIAENNSDIIVISKGDKIDKSIDGGVTFASIKNQLPNHSIRDIAFDPNNDNVMIVVNGSYQANNQKVYITDDGGSNWYSITNNLGDIPVLSVVIDHSDSSYIYLGTEVGVYMKSMSSSVWVPYNQELPNVAVRELEIVNGSNTLKAATWGRGLWEFSLKDRLSFPAIVKTRITDLPTLSLPVENVDQFVTSVVSYDGVLSSVYVKWSIDNPVFDVTINMTNTADSTWVSDTPFTSQPFGTKIYFKVFAVGSEGDTTETYKFMYTVREQTHCLGSGTMSYQGNITLVDFNAINNPTGKTQPYTDYTSTDYTTVRLDDPYSLTVNLNTDNGNYTYYATAWIDWNQDLDFDDAGEEYQLGTVTNSSDMATDLSPFSITIPSTAALGATKMRVVCNYNGYQNDPCATGYDGEVEDYRLNVVIDDVGITENNSLEGVMIHPNPTESIVYIELNEVVNQSNLKVVNSIGKEVQCGVRELGDRIEVDLSGNSNGIYYLKLKLEGQSKTFKLVKI